MIRPATIGDLPGILEAGRRLHKKTPYKDIPEDVQSVAHTLGQCINNAFGFAAVAERNGKITGFLLGAAVPLWFSKKRSATDIVTYSESPGDGLRLVKAFKAWAWTLPGVVEVTMAQSSGIDTDRTMRIYERAGFEQVGGLFVAFRPAENAEAAA